MYIKKTSDNSTVETIPANDARVAISGAVATINPSSTLDEKTSYYINIDSGAFEDTSLGNDNSGISGTNAWNFTTVDLTNPTVSNLSPSDGATNVSPISNLVITFDEAVSAQGGSDNDIVIKKASDDSTVETIDAQAAIVTGSGTTTITINPISDLLDSTEYYVQVGIGAFDDESGNSYAGISNTTSWNFTTGDTTNPLVVSFSPLDGASNVLVSDNLIITFDEEVDAESGDITILKAADDSEVEVIDVTSGQVSGSGTSTITVNPTSNLAYETDYYVQIDATAFDDGDGNSYSGISDTTTWNFRTAAEQRSVSSQTSSSDGEGGLPTLINPVDNYKQGSKTLVDSRIQVSVDEVFTLKVKAVDADQVQRVIVKVAGKEYAFILNDSDSQNPIFVGDISIHKPGEYTYRVAADYGWTVRRRQGVIIVKELPTTQVIEVAGITPTPIPQIFRQPGVASAPSRVLVTDQPQITELQKKEEIISPFSQVEEIETENDSSPSTDGIKEQEKRNFSIILSSVFNSVRRVAGLVSNKVLTVRDEMTDSVQVFSGRLSFSKIFSKDPEFMYDKVTIKLASSEGGALNGAQVTLHSDPKIGVTNEAGIVEFENVESGEHELHIQYNGYTSKQSLVLNQEVSEITLFITAEFRKD